MTGSNVLIIACLLSLLSGYATAAPFDTQITGSPVIPLALPAGSFAQIDGPLSMNGLLYFPDGTFQSTASSWTRSGSDAVFTGGNMGIGTTAPAARLDVVVDDAFGSSLQLWSDEGWTGMKTTNSNGLMRYRGSFEVWPDVTNGPFAGRLDVRNTPGAATIQLDGSNGKASFLNSMAVKSVQTYRGSTRVKGQGVGSLVGGIDPPVDLDTLTVNVPADGQLLLTATLDAEISTDSWVNVYRGDLYFKLDETTGPQPQFLVEQKIAVETYTLSQDPTSASTVSLQWVLPVTPAVRTFKTSAFVPTGYVWYWTSTLNAVFIPGTL